MSNQEAGLVEGRVVQCVRCANAATDVCGTCHRSFCAEHFPGTEDCPNCAQARRDGFVVGLLSVCVLSLPCCVIKIFGHMSLQTHVEFRDKALKILGSIAKAAMVADAKNADVKSLVSEVSRVRKWLKFLKILRMYKGNVKNFQTDLDPMARLEIAADFAQMISEDLSTLHQSGLWTGLLKFPVIKDIGIWEDRAWLLWSTAAFVNSVRDLQAVATEFFASDRSEKFQKKLIGCLLSTLKFACEIGDSSIALIPADRKRGIESRLILASAVLGGTSALCSIHKFLNPSFY